MKFNYTHDLSKKELKIEETKITYERFTIKDKKTREFVQNLMDENRELKKKIQRLAEESQ